MGKSREVVDRSARSAIQVSKANEVTEYKERTKGDQARGPIPKPQTMSDTLKATTTSPTWNSSWMSPKSPVTTADANATATTAMAATDVRSATLGQSGSDVEEACSTYTTCPRSYIAFKNVFIKTLKHLYSYFVRLEGKVMGCGVANAPLCHLTTPGIHPVMASKLAYSNRS